MSRLQTHLTVAIAKSEGDDSDSEDDELRPNVLKPEAIRLNPSDKSMWRPF